MSETDDDGGIDKEALREELREKYERDEREREATQRMSDLLLKGATMTNTHCGTCGDPFFQQDGTTFCPSCHGGPEGVEASVGEAGDGSTPPAADLPATDAVDGDAADVNAADRDAAGGNAAADRPATDRGAVDDDRTAESEPGARPSADDVRSFDAAESPANPGVEGEPAGSSGDRADRSPGHGPDGIRPATGGRVVGDLAGARDSLVAALERFSREAAETDDPRYARECLQAAREAAEALAALGR
ncbi:Sjogren's syndrome/scleroderma autoantigen 1 family protein [Halovivax sp.]|uniref:Sjogren's syndrome/scleroderma autoantigen 1 family protein n=1 Tax=Halovivax sp. TaxID=1935978 RepID=UPI0025C497EB|nr:Sjogren's syndrome/scleroderma autoantigen 1 family protein [Halovivax sp.]